MLAHDRQKIILSLVEQQGSIRTPDLIHRFGVSLETIRRDLEGLESAGRLKRVYGGAVLDQIHASPQSLEERKRQHQREKSEIGTTVCRYLREGQSLALDAGTTTMEVARALKRTFQKLIVLTNSLDILNELADAPGFELLCPGGQLNAAERTFVGEMAEAAASSFHVDTAVLSVSGISLREGITDYGFGEVSFKKKLLLSAGEVIVTADSQKFDVVSLIKVCPWGEVHRIITDSQLPEAVLQRYVDAGCPVIRA